MQPLCARIEASWLIQKAMQHSYTSMETACTPNFARSLFSQSMRSPCALIGSHTLGEVLKNEVTVYETTFGHHSTPHSSISKSHWEESLLGLNWRERKVDLNGFILETSAEEKSKQRRILAILGGLGYWDPMNFSIFTISWSIGRCTMKCYCSFVDFVILLLFMLN